MFKGMVPQAQVNKLQEALSLEISNAYERGLNQGMDVMRRNMEYAYKYKVRVEEHVGVDFEPKRLRLIDLE